MVKISLIEPNRDQPRKDFNEEELQELAESIKELWCSAAASGSEKRVHPTS